MTIGILFTMRKINGGAYQYAVTILETLRENPRHKYAIFNLSPDLPEEYRRLSNFEVVDLQNSPPLPSLIKEGKGEFKTKLKVFLHNLLLRLHLFSLLRALTKISQRRLINLIKSKNLDLMFLTMTHKLAFLLPIPTIVPIHDLQHRINPQFPELSSGKIWAEREYLFSNAAKFAAKILVDSEVGREDVLACYKTDPKKIEILRFLPPDYLDESITRQVPGLPEKFIFYPAQLWPHKNHLNLVKALGILKQQELLIDLVLTGAKKDKWGIYEALAKLISELGLESQVHYLGYVDNEEITMLYKRATAMVMPTFLGPTNIPVYEAWQMGCPVLYSDVRGCREQAGNAALLFDPANPRDIAEKIRQVWQDESLRQSLIQKGHERLFLWTKTDFANKVNNIIEGLEREKPQS